MTDLDRTPRAPLTIRAGARPFEMTVMLGGLTVGAAGMFDTAARSPAIVDSFGMWAAWWYGSLVVWCGLVLVSLIPQALVVAKRGWSTLVHPRGEERLAIRLRLEQAGMIGFSGTAAAYLPAVLANTGSRGWTAGIWIGLFAAASLWRASEIFIDLRKLGRVRKNPVPAFPIPLGDPGLRR